MKKIFLIILHLLFTSSAFGNIDLWNTNRHNWTALMNCVYESQINRTDSLINAGLNINEQNPAGYTALWVAIMKGDSKFAKFLLMRGANPNIVDTSGHSLLMTACETNRFKIIKFMLSDSVLVNYEIAGNTALSTAACFSSPKVLRLLLKHGANVNVRSKIDNSTALSLTKYYYYQGHVYKRKYKLLKRHGAIE